MKKSILIFFLIASSLKVNSQGELTFKITLQKGVYAELRSVIYQTIEDANTADPLDGPHVMYQDNRRSAITPLESITGRVFKIDSLVVGKKNIYYDSELFYRVHDIKSGEVLYFRYNTNKNRFPFVIASDEDEKAVLEHNTEAVTNEVNTNKIIEKIECDELFKKKDDFTGEIRISTPGMDLEEDLHCKFIKYISRKGIVSYYLYLATTGITANYGEKGVYIILGDGSQFKKPQAEIDISVASNLDYEYSAFIPITLAELNLFLNKPIKKFRLFIYDQVVENFHTEYLKCLKSAK